MCEVIIIGGMAAGCKAAARLNRLCPNYQITIIEKGSLISFSCCGLPFYASGEVNDLSDLNKTSYGVVRDKKYFRQTKSTSVLLNTLVTEIDTEGNRIKCIDLEKKEEFELTYDYLILATGSESIKPSFPYPSSPLVSSFHSPSDSKYFRKAAQKGEIEKAAVIGGGFIGCEIVEALSSLWGIETTLIEKEKSILCPILDREISNFVINNIPTSKIKLMLGTTVQKIELNENEKPVIYLENGQQHIFDFVFYCLGAKPNTKLAEESGIDIGNFGGIVVNEQMRTNVNNILAAGDCVEIKNLITEKPDYFAFGSLSNRMGRVAADSIAGKCARRDYVFLKGAVGTSSLKLFDDIICSSGLTEHKAKKLGYKTGSVIGCWYDRPDYNPESKNLLGKLVFEKTSLKLLGLQLVGEGEVTRYIDVFSELLAQNKKVEDLVNLEHGYTPFHSSPISPLNNLGFMAINQEKDHIKNYNPLKLSCFNGTFIDVREIPEVVSYPFPENSIQIPLSELHLIWNDFDLEQPIMFICEKGSRSYEAARMFYNYGYKNVSYLGGGNLLYESINQFSEYLEKNYEY